MNNVGKADLKLLKELYPKNYSELLKKIKKHYPIQYLIGYVDFYNLKINVNKYVLIPRFETELLIKYTLDYLATKKYHNLLDIGTGSGCIAIALAKNTNLKIEACDISNQALKIAKNNSLQNKVKINFFQKDILKENIYSKYDVIISNPPYLTENEIVSEETIYEPNIALYAKNNGLEFYQVILEKSKNFINKKGTIIFEIGANQKEEIEKIALSVYPRANINVLKDFNNYNRYMFISL